MTLVDKLKEIERGKNPVELPKMGEDHTIGEFWDNFVEPRLPKPAVAVKWHELLMKYIARPDAVFAIRYNFPKNVARRGFFTETDAGCSFHYVDNIQAKYFCKMCLDGDILTGNETSEKIDKLVDEMIDTYRSFKFPAREGQGKHPPEKGDEAIFPKKSNASFKGLYLAHLLSIGKKKKKIEKISKEAYYDKSSDTQLEQWEIIQNYFYGGDVKDYCTRKTLSDKSYLCRDHFPLDEIAKKYLIAMFLRYVHPFNYFWVPGKNMTDSWVERTVNGKEIFRGKGKIIGEYDKLIQFAQKKMRERYKDYSSQYDEFLDMVMPVNTSVENIPDYTETVIDFHYSKK